MIKRCTNSACRKKFSTLDYGNTCPHCGKVYPQLAETGPLFANLRVIYHHPDSIYHHPDSQRFKAIKCVRDLVRCYENRQIGLRGAKAFADGKSNLIGISIDTAEIIRSELRKYGLKVSITTRKVLTEAESKKIAQDSLDVVERIRKRDQGSWADIHSRDFVPIEGSVLEAQIVAKYSFGIIVDIGFGPLQYGILDEGSLPERYKNAENTLVQGDTIFVRVASVDLIRHRISFTYPEEGNRSIDALNFSVRTYNCLKRAGVNTLNDIFSNYPNLESLKKIRNLGRRSVEEVIEKINSFGIPFLVEKE